MRHTRLFFMFMPHELACRAARVERVIHSMPGHYCRAYSQPMPEAIPGPVRVTLERLDGRVYAAVTYHETLPAGAVIGADFDYYRPTSKQGD